MNAKKNTSEKTAGTGKPMIEAIGLSKFYGAFAATKDISFQVPKGQVAAFLGPNGAGKSTTMKLLTGYLTPSEGRAKIGGHDLRTERLAASRMIGYLPENGPLYEEMTPLALLRYLGRARGLSRGDLKSRMEYVVENCALAEVLRKPVRKLSRGYRQRVGMAQALLHDPEVLILDEPTSGLDPNQQHEARELILQLGRQKTILLSTHILQEVKAVCSRVILINEGRLVFDGKPGELESSGESLDQSFRRLTIGAAT